MIPYHSDKPVNNNLKCILENGTVTNYDAAAPKKNAYDKRVFKFVGKGKIHSIYGILQNQALQKPEYFFIRV